MAGRIVSAIVCLLVVGFVAACSTANFGSLGVGSCLLNGEDFTNVTDATVEFRTHSIPQRVLDTYSKAELKVHRAPSSHQTLLRDDIYPCVVKKAGWPEAVPAEINITPSDVALAMTPRGQEVRLWPYDIDHWHLSGSSPFVEVEPRWE